MSSLKLSHLAIACSEIEMVAKQLAVLALEVAEDHDVPTEGVRAAMIPCAVSQAFRIELVAPTVKTSPIAKFLEKRPQGGLHHMCFEVTHLEKWHQRLQEKGLEVLPPGIRKAARGKALFLHPRCMGGVLVELEEIE